MGLDLVLRGGLVVDGTGTPARRTDVGVEGDRIVAVGDLSAVQDSRVIEIDGRVVSPGFIDIHTHSDLTLLSDPRARSKIRQGVTTEVLGNCGMSPSPAVARPAEVRRAIGIIDLDPDVAWTWGSYAEYTAALAAARPALNVAPLVGHVALRVDAAGEEVSIAGGALAGMERASSDALDQGAWGLSTGLMYPPAMFADAAELAALARVVAAHDAVFAVHMRDYSDRLLPAVEEAIEVARASGARLQISHLAVAGRRNWGAVARAVEAIERARADGHDLAFDTYPYLAGSANLSQLLPTWAQEGGSAEVTERTGDPVMRRRIVDEWRARLHLGWNEIEVAWVDPGMEALLGRTIAAIAAERGTDAAHVALDLIRETQDRVLMVAYGRSADDLRAAITHPLCSIGSDGLAMDPDGPTGAGRPHPRSFGCYPRLLGRTVREDGWLSLEAAIEAATSRPAARVGLRDRGAVREGALADLVVLHPDVVLDAATFREPTRFPLGVEHVLVNGILAVRDGEETGERAGRVLQRGGSA